MLRAMGAGSLVIAALTVFITGCGKSAPNPAELEEETRRIELRDVFGLFELHQTEKRRPPAKLQDVATYEPGYTIGFAALQKGDSFAIWGVDVSKKDPNTLLAYRKEVPKEGGLVIMADQKIKKVTAEEFKSLKK
jgi:hypothetical protein